MKKSKAVTIVTIILIYIILLFVIFSNSKKSKDAEKFKGYLVIDNFVNLVYSNNRWSNVSNTSTIEDSTNKFKIYIDFNYFGDYKLEYGKVWNLFDDNKAYVDYTGELFAYSNNMDISLNKTNYGNLGAEQKEIIKNYFSYSNYDYLLANDVVNVDLDNNGEEDEIVSVSNFGDSSEFKSQYYNLLYIKLNGKIINIINDNSSNSDPGKYGVLNISKVFTYKNKTYFILKKTFGIDSDDPMEKFNMYEYSKNKITNINVN